MGLRASWVSGMYIDEIAWLRGRAATKRMFTALVSDEPDIQGLLEYAADLEASANELESLPSVVPAVCATRPGRQRMKQGRPLNVIPAEIRKRTLGHPQQRTDKVVGRQVTAVERLAISG